jgi:hypothetical protein
VPIKAAKRAKIIPLHTNIGTEKKKEPNSE